MKLPTRDKTVRLKDIAELCGVSTATVSRALKDPERHSKKLTQRIRKATEALGYDPDLHQGARRLSMQRHGKHIPNQMIGVILPFYFQHNQYFYDFFTGILDTLAPAGFGTIILNEAPYPACLRRGEIDGIIAESIEAAAIRQLRSEPGFGQRPLIIGSQRQSDVCSVQPDYNAGMATLTEALLNRGTERLVYLCRDTTSSLKVGKHSEQYAGILDALSSHKLNPNEVLALIPVRTTLWNFSYKVQHLQDHAELQEILDSNTEEQFIQDVRNAKRPTAVLAPNDAMATIAVLLLEKAGLKVPEDVQVTGFDGINPLEAYLGTHSLTTLIAPLRDCGSRAAEIMLQHLEQNPDAILPVENITLTAKLQWGNTTR